MLDPEFSRQITEGFKDTRQAFGFLQEEIRRVEGRLAEKITKVEKDLSGLSHLETSIEIIKVKVSAFEEKLENKSKVLDEKFEDKIRVIHHRLDDAEKKTDRWIAVIALVAALGKTFWDILMGK